jgi:hypothetical protein
VSGLLIVLLTVVVTLLTVVAVFVPSCAIKTLRLASRGSVDGC